MFRGGRGDGDEGRTGTADMRNSYYNGEDML